MSIIKPITDGLNTGSNDPSAWPHPWQILCEPPYMQWGGSGPYSTSGGHWACWARDENRKFYPFWGDYDYGFTMCMGMASKFGVPEDEQVNWCTGAPYAHNWLPLLNVPDQPLIPLDILPPTPSASSVAWTGLLIVAAVGVAYFITQ